MADIVNQYNIGVVSEDFTPGKLAEKLKAITRIKLSQFKTDTQRAAEDLSANQNKERITSLLSQLLHR